MKLYTFDLNGNSRVGLEHHGRLIDVASAAVAIDPAASTRLSADMLTLVRAWDQSLPALRTLSAKLDQAGAAVETAPWSLDLAKTRILAPIPRPPKILCSGINYRGHLEENPGATLPTEPFFFAKMPSNVIGPGVPIRLPKMTQQMDYEVEFAVVISRRLQAAPESAIMDSVAGYTILHDVSARDVQMKGNQITLGKNFDGFCPLGPCIVTTDELKNPAEVGLRSFVNGEIRQNGSNRDWLFTLPKLLSFLSNVMTLEPGDVVSTGTPAGVGLFRKPQVFLKPGDVVRLEIDGIGSLENAVVAG